MQNTRRPLREAVVGQNGAEMANNGHAAEFVRQNRAEMADNEALSVVLRPPVLGGVAGAASASLKVPQPATSGEYRCTLIRSSRMRAWARSYAA